MFGNPILDMYRTFQEFTVEERVASYGEFRSTAFYLKGPMGEFGPFTTKHKAETELCEQAEYLLKLRKLV